MLTGEQIRAARALLRWEQSKLSAETGLSVKTVNRLEANHGTVSAHTMTVEKVQRAMEAAGIEFIPQNGGGPGVRLRYPL